MNMDILIVQSYTIKSENTNNVNDIIDYMESSLRSIKEYRRTNYIIVYPYIVKFEKSICFNR